MGLSRIEKILGVSLLLCILLDILLTPVGLETRSTADVTSLGLVAGVLSLAGLVLSAFSLVLVIRGSRRAPVSGVFAGLLFLPGIAVDWAGLFHTSQAAPVGVIFVEVSLLAVAVATIVLAVSVSGRSRI